MTRILLTGASGFIGGHLLQALEAAGCTVRCALRRPLASLDADQVIIGSLQEQTEWEAALKDIEVVIHLGAHVHIVNKNADQAPFFLINRDATGHLARCAAQNGVKRFIFLSSIKVNGEKTSLNAPFTEHCLPQPQDAYAQSKWQAEQVLQDIAAHTGMGLVIIRPPLVYGPGVKANFLRLLQHVHCGWPLPFANAYNQRSFVFIDNLTQAIISTVIHPHAPGHCFLVADNETWSMSGLVKQMAESLDRKPRLFPIPLKASRHLLRWCNKEHLASRLFDSLVVSNASIKQKLQLDFNTSATEGVAKTAAWYLSTIKHHAPIGM